LVALSGSSPIALYRSGHSSVHTTPLGLNSKVALPPIWSVPLSISLEPKPVRPRAATGGPPTSRQVRRNGPSAPLADIQSI